MEHSRKSPEQGQVLVFVVLALVVLLGFVALVIDGGSIYSARRIAQNAADASALAGASNVATRIRNETNKDWNCSALSAHNGNWSAAITKAVERAADNDFTIEPIIDNDNGVEIVCAGSSGAEAIDVHVRITKPVDTYLMQIVGITGPVNTVDAVARVTPRLLFAEGAAIVATKGSCSNVPGQSDGGVLFEGTVDLNINQGGIVSNNCCGVNGSSNVIHIIGGSWTCAGGDPAIDLNPHPPRVDPGDPTPTPLPPGSPTAVPPNIDPTPGPGSPININADPVNAQLSAACGAPVSQNSPNITGNPKILTIDAAILGTPVIKYRNVDVRNGETLILKNGLFCFYGSVDVNNGGMLKTENATIFMPSTAGSFLINGSADLSAPPIGCEYDTVASCSPRIGGLLILYMPDDVGGGTPNYFKMAGNPESNYQGTVLVPNTAVVISGTADMPCNATVNRTQIVAETVAINGSGNVCINYDTDYVFSVPGFLNMQR